MIAFILFKDLLVLKTMGDSSSCTVLSIYTVLEKYLTSTHLLRSTLLEHLQHYHLVFNYYYVFLLQQQFCQ